MFMTSPGKGGDKVESLIMLDILIGCWGAGTEMA